MIKKPHKRNLALAICQASKMLRVRLSPKRIEIGSDMKFMFENKRFIRECHRVNTRDISWKASQSSSKNSSDSDFSKKRIRRSPTTENSGTNSSPRVYSTSKVMITTANSSIDNVRKTATPSPRGRNSNKYITIISKIQTELDKSKITNKNLSNMRLKNMKKISYYQKYL